MLAHHVEYIMPSLNLFSSAKKVLTSFNKLYVPTLCTICPLKDGICNFPFIVINCTLLLNSCIISFFMEETGYKD